MMGSISIRGADTHSTNKEYLGPGQLIMAMLAARLSQISFHVAVYAGNDVYK